MVSKLKEAKKSTKATSRISKKTAAKKANKNSILQKREKLIQMRCDSKFKCTSCSRKFTAKSSLDRHLLLNVCITTNNKRAIQMSATKLTSKSKKGTKESFICLHCKVNFTAKSSLVRHSLLKVCPAKPKSSATKESLRKETKAGKNKKKNGKNKKKKRNSGALEPVFKKVRKLYSTKFEGNSDSEGSIDSAALDEDICFECGTNTLYEQNWESLLICDRCSGEYHLKCVGLDMIPRRGWICRSCKQEMDSFEGLNYSMDEFEIPKQRKNDEITIVYSPSKPLARAWEECKEKGFMCVSKVFDYEIIKYIFCAVLLLQIYHERLLH